MKKIAMTVAAVAVAAGTVLAAAPAATAATDASAATAVAAKQTVKDKRYLRDTRADAPSLALITDALLIRSGKQTCTTLKSGATAYDVIIAGVDAGLEDDEITSLIANAVIYYCPGQAYKFSD